jgi:hypothetical protein
MCGFWNWGKIYIPVLLTGCLLCHCNKVYRDKGILQEISHLLEAYEASI